MADSCEVCFNPYDENQRRPRVLTCGHSYCSLCIDNHLVENKLVCPTCRKEHIAMTSADFPINYAIEKYLQSTISDPTKPQTTTGSSEQVAIAETQTETSPSEQLTGISRSLCSFREEHCKEIKKVIADIRGNRSHMQGYKSQMNTWKEEHQNQIEFHQTCIQKHNDVITTINKETQDVEDTSEHGDNILQKMGTSVNDLNVATTSKELLVAMEKSSHNYDIARDWNSEVQKTYPNRSLIVRSQELREQSRSVMGKLRPRERTVASAGDQCSLDTVEDFSATEDNDQFISIEKKIECLLASLDTFQIDCITQTDENLMNKEDRSAQTHETSFFNVSDLKALTPSARLLIKSKRVFAVQQLGKETRYAKVTLSRNLDICVHTLRKDISIPENAIFIQHEDVVSPNIRPGLTFLVLAAEGRHLGRLRIRLVPDGNYPLNFHRLCTGEAGPSYAHSRVFNVWWRDVDNECVGFGDYEANNGKGGKGVIPGVDWEIEQEREDIYGNHKFEAGSLILSGASQHVKTASQFAVFTKDRINMTIHSCFGKVEEGLNVLKKALSHYNDDEIKKKVTIADCGIILPRSCTS